MKNILVIGSINIDYTISVESFPMPGETITGKSLNINYGGKGLNQAFAASVLGSNVKILGKINYENDSRHLLSYLKKNNINTTLIKNSNEKTGMAIIEVDNKSENKIVVVPGANYDMDKHFIDENIEEIKRSDVIILQNEIPIFVNEYIIEIANKYNIKVVLNLAPAKKISLEVLSKIDYLIVNETELKFIYLNMFNNKTFEEKKAIEKLLDNNIKSIILTKGSKGSQYIDKNHNIFAPSIKVNAVDTTGAGDAFIGAFFTKLDIINKNYEEALLYANKVAAKSVQYNGAQVIEIGGMKCQS